MLDCPDLAVPREVMQHVVHVESSRNPYAIGVVGGYLARQPKNLEEALATVRQLKEEGYNFSVGIAQVNRYNLAKYGLKTYEQSFAVCPNLQAGSRILRECYDRAQDWGKAFSCYYSGNFATGFQHGYVQKIFASIQKSQATPAAGADPIRVIPYSNAPRKRAASDDLPVRSPASPVGGGAATATSETEEARPAIPVPGPGALLPQAGAGRGFAHIPTQVVGVNGDPYQTKMLPPSGPTRSRAALPLPSVPSALSSPTRRVVDTSNARLSSTGSVASRGGVMVQSDSTEPAGLSAATKSDPAPTGEGSASRESGERRDRSFVF
jgi:type IV secretion system protein VirB1